LQLLPWENFDLLTITTAVAAGAWIGAFLAYLNKRKQVKESRSEVQELGVFIRRDDDGGFYYQKSDSETDEPDITQEEIDTLRKILDTVEGAQEDGSDSVSEGEKNE
jgi:hypothetical protein